MPHDAPTGRAALRPAATETVDVALVLAADASGSISAEDMTLQFRGYASAIASDAFVAAVRSGGHGRIALTFAAWSGVRRQQQIVPWTVIDAMPAAERFAAALLAARHPAPEFTSISGAIDFSRNLLAHCEYPAMRQVIDVSGDGKNNDGRAVTHARNDAVAVGIRINGLPIVRNEPDIAAYYALNVIGGPAAFVTVVNSMADFQSATLEKLVTEIAMDPNGMRDQARFA